MKKERDSDEKIDQNRSDEGCCSTTIDPNSVRYIEKGKELIENYRSVAADTCSIYTYCFVSTRNQSRTSAFFSFTMLITAIMIQSVVPIAIVLPLQPVEGIDGDITGRLCPNRSSVITKLIALSLSLFFVILTICICLKKLRGFAFLRSFVNLGWRKRIYVDLGILSNLISMGFAGAAQYLLFIGNGGNDALTKLLLQSLAMQFVLSVDVRIVGDIWGAWTKDQVLKLSDDSQICGWSNEDFVEDEKSVPPEVLKKIYLLYHSELGALTMFSVVGFCWSIALSICM